MLSFLFLFIVACGASYCSLTGCVNAEVCTCPPFFFFCDTTTESQGLCTLTEAGIWVIIGLIIALIILFVLAVSCCCCCWCCKWRGKKEVVHKYKSPTTVV
jgi:hypothetical protein